MTTEHLPVDRRVGTGRIRRPAAVAAVAVVAAFGAAACGDDSASTTTAPAPTTTDGGGSTSGGTDGPVHNSVDVSFAQGMIPHHAQAVDMSELAWTNTSNPDVLELAAEIIAAQGPEIELMTNWLRSWGASVPDPEATMDENMQHSDGMMMSGMISEGDFDKLRAARDAEFDRLYLELMILHHEGAIEMAQQQIDGGDSPEATELARQIITTQQDEIIRMEELLNRLG